MGNGAVAMPPEPDRRGAGGAGGDGPAVGTGGGRGRYSPEEALLLSVQRLEAAGLDARDVRRPLLTLIRDGQQRLVERGERGSGEDLALSSLMTLTEAIAQRAHVEGLERPGQATVQEAMAAVCPVYPFGES